MNNEILIQRLTELYKQGKASIITINNAVSKGWITAEKANEIMSLAQINLI